MENNISNIYRFFDNKDDVEDRDKYKYFTENDPRILETKTKISIAIAKRGLFSFMNDTKWLELQEAIHTLSFPPAYIEKLVLEATDLEREIFTKAPSYFGNWRPFYEEGMSPFFTIEWIKICPRYAKYRGRLVEPEIFDQTRELEKILKKHFIPYESENGIFTIFGYR